MHPIASPGKRLQTAPLALEQESWIGSSIGRRVRTQLATVALLVLTLVLGFGAIWQSASVSEHSPRPPALIRALASVTGGVANELLVTTLGAEELPPGEKEAFFYRLTLPPGTSLPYLAGPLCGCWGELAKASAGAEIVQSGAYTLRLEAPMRIQREGASHVVEEIPARTAVMLGSGDTAIYPQATASGVIGNDGDEPVVVVGVAISSTKQSGVPAPLLPTGVTLEVLAHAATSSWQSLPSGPVSVSVWQLTLPKGTSVGPYEATGLESLWIESGTIHRRFWQRGATAGSQPMIHPAGTEAPFIATTPGVRRVITSEDDGPAVLLVLSIEPAGVWSRSLAPGPALLVTRLVRASRTWRDSCCG